MNTGANTKLIAKRLSRATSRQDDGANFIISVSDDVLNKLLRLPSLPTQEQRLPQARVRKAHLWNQALTPGAVATFLTEPRAQASGMRSRMPRNVKQGRRSFLLRVRELNALQMALLDLGVKLCQLQKGFGDFHLKTTLGICAADCIFLSDALNRKLRALETGISSDGFTDEKGPAVVPTKAGLRSVLKCLKKQLKHIRAIRRDVPPFLDIALEELLDLAVYKLTRSLDGVERWTKIGPTPARFLFEGDGLYRDCPVVPPPDPGGTPPRRLSTEDLRDPAIRARYLAASAYLELTSVDIICDLILLVQKEGLPEKRRLQVELAMQLLDECRHAELLAWRVGELGFEFGLIPVDLHTWKLYRSFNSLPEKLVIQQVLQEGLGLDASAINVDEMQSAGDKLTADLYAQIAADECNHVKLGLKWAEWLTGKSPEILIRRVQKRAAKIVPETPVPVVPELRAICGYPRHWLRLEKSRRGERSVEKAFAGLGARIGSTDG